MIFCFLRARRSFLMSSSILLMTRALCSRLFRSARCFRVSFGGGASARVRGSLGSAENMEERLFKLELKRVYSSTYHEQYCMMYHVHFSSARATLLASLYETKDSSKRRTTLGRSLRPLPGSRELPTRSERVHKNQVRYICRQARKATEAIAVSALDVALPILASYVMIVWSPYPEMTPRNKHGCMTCSKLHSKLRVWQLLLVK